VLGLTYLAQVDAMRSILRQRAAMDGTTPLRAALNVCARNNLMDNSRDIILAAALELSEPGLAHEARP
jgi:hypothetical protein